MTSQRIVSSIVAAARSVTMEQSAVALCAVIIVVLGALRIPEPLSGDAALYLGGGRAMSGGAVLYTDYWDMKQPGLFYFNYAAGQLFGFSTIGIRVFELVYWIVAAGLLSWILRPAFRHAFLAAVVPASMLALYFGVLPKTFLGQVEALVNAPILLAAACLVRAGEQERSWMAWSFAAGVLAGFVLVMKLVLAPIFVGMFAVLLLSAPYRQPHRSWVETMRALFPVAAVFACGAGALIALVLLACWRQGNLAALLWTTFVYPSHAVQHAALPSPGRLVASTVQAIAYVAVFLPFIALLWLRPPSQRHRIWVAMMVAWLAFGFLAIALQRYSWWAYHFALLLGPVAMLAALGVDRLLCWLQDERGFDRSTKMVALALVTLPLIATLLHPALRRAEVAAAVITGIQSLDQVSRQRDVEYERQAEAADIVRPLASGTRIYVFGNPILYELLSARQAIAYHGWSPEFTTPDEWKALARDLAGSKPVLVFIEVDVGDLVAQRSPEIASWLKTDYSEAGRARIGRWYRRRS